MAPRKPRTTRSKQDTATEFNDVRNNVESMQDVSVTTAAQTAARAEQVRSLTAGVTPEMALKKLTDTSLAVNKVLAGISETIQNEIAELNQLREAKLIELKELEEIHGKEVVASSIKDLIENYDNRLKELNVQRAEAEESFQKQNESRTQKWLEDERIRADNRKRENDEYNYTTAQARTKAMDEFNAQVSATRRVESIRKEEFERVLMTRENEMKAKEAQFLDFQKQVTEFPDKLKAAEKAEFAKGFNIAQKEAKQEAALAQKDFDAYKTVAENEKKSLNTTIDQQNTIIAKLNGDLTAAYAKVQSISEKALESASGQQTLAQMKEFQASQNQNRNNSKNA